MTDRSEKQTLEYKGRVGEERRLKAKVAIVTGGASGIGEATARVFAEQGARMVVLADIQDELGNQVAASIGTQRCTYIHCDVADEEQVQNLVQSTVDAYGQVDIMFSNAGILSPSQQTVPELDMSQLDRLFAVNVRGMAACVKHAARAMLEGRVRGSIVCTASVGGSHGGPNATDYIMSKHAVLGLMRSASVQLAEHGIRVNCVSPNGLATPLTCKQRGMSEEEGQEVYRKYARLQGVVLTPKHVADAVLFLVSDDSAFVTALDLRVDGGFTLPSISISNSILL
ncbi:(-)-isopiperitenol/(-)-carveol dehydrogenase, mitochondrial isoform X2 [Glycine max]|uniref:(-)-isopiperitenol/(-)-carveol dehydrogenase, mitochondrial n=1 Tax=Glycine soja TaxID=3848 RepID=A0A445KTM9_GLYSO|nr:(-)-isopiperitenol/(-)-carveol dehydrogenase, mitochondrial isoform X2 [Glycine max]RZC14332.1 (-)-isopiperitenol/(-)-carveol dehydrogenase, mitochondrial [Glycine soja]|eukprot:XP_014629870.2 (-)-isopiperitenol/(-)-carveol dehydrogenase, mitochondrial [Glycine max]